jgi:hypothetical protein
MERDPPGIQTDLHELIANGSASVADLYDLDGETFLLSRDGRIETGSLDLMQDLGS